MDSFAFGSFVHSVKLDHKNSKKNNNKSSIDLLPRVLSGYVSAVLITPKNSKKKSKKETNSWKNGKPEFNNNNNNNKNTKNNTPHWLYRYSTRAIDLFLAYRRRFPQLIAYVDSHQMHVYESKNLFRGMKPNVIEVQENICIWLQQLSTYRTPLTPVSSTIASQEHIIALQRIQDGLKLKNKFKKIQLRQVPIQFIHRQDILGKNKIPNSRFCLLAMNCL